jgi:hypothetical protein
LHAQRCFDRAIVTRRKAVAELSATAESAILNARQIALHERAIADAEKRKEETAQNAGSIQKLLSAAAGR